MKMPMGKFKGQPIEAMTTQYLAWLVTQDNIRFKYWPAVKEALRVLRSRFERMDDLMAELQVNAPPQDRRPTPEQIEKRKVEKAEKLRQLEQRRAEERERLRAERLATRMREEIEMQAAIIHAWKNGAPPGVVIDASYYARRSIPSQVDPNDISDLL
jgi:hypothetical protein